MKTFASIGSLLAVIYILSGCRPLESLLSPAGSTTDSANPSFVEETSSLAPGQKYYVSPAGSDSNIGTSPANPWKTIGKVKNHAWSPGFNPGDSVLFQGGQTFTAGTNDYLYIQANKSRSTGSSPLTLGTYGTGRATLKVSGAHGLYVWCSGSRANLGLIVKNLCFQGDGVPLLGYITYGAYIWNSSSSAVDLVSFSNCIFTGFAGDGLITGRDAGKGSFGFVSVQNCVASSNTGLAGMQEPSGSGISVSGASAGLIQYCSAFQNGAKNNWSSGPVGIWTYDSVGVVIRSCESYDNKTSGNDGGGFDIDGSSINCVIEYCYSHGNDGAGYLICQYAGATAFSGNTVRYNISEYDARKGTFHGISFYSAGSSGGIQNTRVYGNTVICNTRPAIGFMTPTGISGTRIWNNIFYTELGKPIMVENPPTNVAKFEGNLYWMTGGSFNLAGYSSLSAWQNATGQEKYGGAPVGLQTDPLLTNPGLGGTVGDPISLVNLNAYRLQSGSPAVGSGLDLNRLYGVDPGPRDFFANSVPQRNSYDIGAHELP